MTITINPISDLTVESNVDQTTFDLLNYFDDPMTTGLVANFQLYNTSLGNGTINIVLFDQAGAGAPLTSQNFVNYVNEGAYTNSIIHRSVRNFVIQGGGYTVEQQLTPQPIPTNPPVQNEYSSTRPNLRGTIAMAKQGGNPNSATNQWFFNLNDNSAILGPQNNGGFTVFGQVLSSADLETIDAIAAVPVFRANTVFTEIPLLIDPDNLVIDSVDNFVRFSQITVSQAEELRFSVSSSDTGLVKVSLDGQQILLDYQPNQFGTADITITATNLLGEEVQDSFTVTIIDPVFDPASYGASNPDLIPFYIQSGYDLAALTNHYLTYGRFEGRPINTFDEFRYTASSYVTGGDLINAFGLNGAEATLHYLNYGFTEGRPTTAFDPARYLDSYDDLLNAFGMDTAAATQHFITNGFAPDGRNPNLFPSDEYLASYGDLINAFAPITDYGAKIQAASSHYLFNGRGEGRQITFNPFSYLAANPDVAAAYNNDPTLATEHYILYGFSEGRPMA